MIFKEFGDKKKPLIVLLHGGGLSYWSLQHHIKRLQSEYFIVAPIIDGHGDDDCVFTSIEDSGDTIIRYVQKHQKKAAYMIYELSLGAQIATYIISKNPDLFAHAIIESALVYPMKAVSASAKLMYDCMYPLVSKRWFAFLQAKSMFLPDSLHEQYYMDSKKISKQSLINISKSNASFDIKNMLKNVHAKTLIVVGEKELHIMKKSAQCLNEQVKDSHIKKIKGCGHGQLLFQTPDRHIDIMQKFIE
jgi:pimeloyl-ACP methyl ester carboxylesterase